MEPRGRVHWGYTKQTTNKTKTNQGRPNPNKKRRRRGERGARSVVGGAEKKVRQQSMGRKGVVGSRGPQIFLSPTPGGINRFVTVAGPTKKGTLQKAWQKGGATSHIGP